MINVLITAIGGDIGQGVLKSLRISKREIRVVGADMDSTAAGLYLCDKGYLLESATKNEEKYFATLIKICQREKISLALVCHEAEQALVSKNLKYLGQQVKTHFVVQPAEVAVIWQDKVKTYEVLQKNGVRVPQTCCSVKDLSNFIKKNKFPLIVKSRTGSGSRHFQVVENLFVLKKIWSEMLNPIVQEYISNDKNEEYTVGLFLDNQSKVLGAIPMLRKLRFGLTWHAIVDDFRDVVTVATKAAESIKAIGPCNVQLRRARSGQLCVIEINARISSTTAFRAMLGFNEAMASIDYFLYNKLPKLKFKKGVAMKTWGELIIPFKEYQNLQKNNFVVNKIC